MSVNGRGRIAGPRLSRPDGAVEVAREGREALLVLVAALAFMCGLVHTGAAVDHYDELALYTLTFGLIAATQMLWAGMVLRGASDRLLVAGGVFNLAIVGLWVLSRTVGVPIAPQAWVAESVGVADLMETVGEIVVVLTVWSVVFSTRLRLARRVSEHIAPLLVFALFAMALVGVGAHAG